MYMRCSVRVHLNISETSMKLGYRFAFGPWNIHEGADPFGPTVRATMPFAKKVAAYRQMGFEGIEFHDDDAVADVDSKSASQVEAECRTLKKMLDNEGLVVE